MKEDERHVYGLCKDDVEGYVELSEVMGGMFDQSRQGWYSYIKDQVGTIYKVYSDNTKQIIDIRTYDVFGNMVNRNGSSTGNLGFQGKYYDNESGLYYFYHRYYNPDNGRFINEDPIGLSGGLNMYGFVDNDPVHEIDPFGLKRKKFPRSFARPPYDEFGRPNHPRSGRRTLKDTYNEIGNNLKNGGTGAIEFIYKLFKDYTCYDLCFRACIVPKMMGWLFVEEAIEECSFKWLYFVFPSKGITITIRIVELIFDVEDIFQIYEFINYCHNKCLR